MSNYYNEHDPDAAAILRVLIDEGLIAPGIVDERSIEDVRPDELVGYTQVHLFAGFGIWGLALREAGVSDDEPLWTCSCPCQPFSAAGKGDGFADERHLWPAAYHLITQCRPPKILGEQVASKAVDVWIDLVQADLEAMGYAFGCVPFPAAGVGSPQIRDRAYWVANADCERYDRVNPLLHGDQPGRVSQDCLKASRGGEIGGVGHADGGGYIGRRASEASNGRNAPWVELERLCDAGGMAHAGPNTDAGETATANHERTQAYRSADQFGGCGELGNPGPTNGPWRAADWLFCTDGKWRAVEPGSFPLAHAGAFRNRVAALRGAGNAINVEAAKVWIEAVKECA